MARKIYLLRRGGPGTFRIEAINPDSLISELVCSIFNRLGFSVKLSELGEPPYPVPLLKVCPGGRTAEWAVSPNEDDELLAYIEPLPAIHLSEFFACETLEQALMLCETYDSFAPAT